MVKSSLVTRSKSLLLLEGLTLTAVEVETIEAEDVEDQWVAVEDSVLLAVATATVEAVDSPVVVADSRELETGNVLTQLVTT